MREQSPKQVDTLYSKGYTVSKFQLQENISVSTQAIHITILHKFRDKHTASKGYDLSKQSIQKKLKVEIQDIMDEADSMNDQLASVRIKKFIDRIFSISMLVTPYSPNISRVT